MLHDIYSQRPPLQLSEKKLYLWSKQDPRTKLYLSEELCPARSCHRGWGDVYWKAGETNIKEKKNSYRTHLCLKNTHWQAYKDNCVLMWTLWNLWLWLYIQPFLNKSVHWLHMCGTPFSTDDKAKGSHKVSLRNWKCIGSNVDKTDCIKPS